MVKEAIRTAKLSKRYGTKNVVNNLNLSIKSGEIVGFLGLNGAGKTTTMRTFYDLDLPDVIALRDKLVPKAPRNYSLPC